ncbi:MAG: hypothetical protein WBX25_29300 [Rhodomicrobium sp.]
MRMVPKRHAYAIYPILLMPAWLQTVSRVNPRTYEVDGLRSLMLQGGTSVYGLPLDFAVLLATAGVSPHGILIEIIYN